MCFTLFTVLTGEEDFKFQSSTQMELGLCPEGTTACLKYFNGR